MRNLDWIESSRVEVCELSSFNYLDTLKPELDAFINQAEKLKP